MKFVASIITTIVVLSSPVFAMDHLEGKEPEEKTFISKALPTKIFEKDKKYEIPNYPTSVICRSIFGHAYVSVGTAYVFSNCLEFRFNVHNSETIIGKATFKYFPDHTGFLPRFEERGGKESVPMDFDEKIQYLRKTNRLELEKFSEPELLKDVVDQMDLLTTVPGSLGYKMYLGLSMPILYLDDINIEQGYKRKGYEACALETIITAFRNSPDSPEDVHILLQCERDKPSCVGSPESEHKKFFKCFGFESIDAFPIDRHFMTVSLKDITFPRLKKKVQ